MITRQRITSAFRDLRKAGYFAKQNFWCCQTCGWSAIPVEEKKVVFYHLQDGASIKKGILIKPLYLAWAGDGNEIVNILAKYGLQTEWDGSTDTRIAILP
jgi:hypothetical protein